MRDSDLGKDGTKRKDGESYWKVWGAIVLLILEVGGVVALFALIAHVSKGVN